MIHCYSPFKSRIALYKEMIPQSREVINMSLAEDKLCFARIGVIIPAASQATAKLTQNSEMIFR